MTAHELIEGPQVTPLATADQLLVRRRLAKWTRPPMLAVARAASA
jgi:hypothetical protein